MSSPASSSTTSESTNTKKMLKLRSSDDQIFEVEEDVAIRSETIKNLVEDGCADNVIPLTNVDGKTLAKIIKWGKKHEEAIIKNNTDEEKEELNAWKAQFFDDLDVKVELYNLLNAANYLDEKDLLASCCQRVAELIKGKTPAQVRTIFGIVDSGFTPEEEEEIQRQHAWAFQ